MSYYPPATDRSTHVVDPNADTVRIADTNTTNHNSGSRHHAPGRPAALIREEPAGDTRAVGIAAVDVAWAAGTPAAADTDDGDVTTVDLSHLPVRRTGRNLDILTEWELVRLIQTPEDGEPFDGEAFGVLYQRHLNGIYRFVYGKTGSRQVAEDITADTFLAALRHIRRLQNQGREVAAWLYSIAKNSVADYHRLIRRRPEIVTDTYAFAPIADAGSSVDDVIEMIDNRAVLAAIRVLAPLQQEAIARRFLLDQSIRDTAAAMDKSETVVKALVYRAVRRMRDLLGLDGAP